MEEPMSRYFWVAFLTLFFAVVSPPAYALDCAKAYLPVDFVICSDPAVIRANDAHEKAWYDARAHLSDAEKQQLLADQRRWLKEYPPRCEIPARGGRPTVISRDQQLCVDRALEERTVFLEQYASSTRQASSSTRPTTRPPESQTTTSATVLPGPGQASNGPGPFSNIRQVDFLNFTYPTGPNDCSNPPPDGRRTVDITGGRFMKQFGDGELQYEIDKRHVAFGNITGSPTDEAVIALRCSFMPNFWANTIYIYTLKNGLPVRLATITGDTIEKDYTKYYSGNDNGPVWDVSSMKAGGGRIILEGLVDSPHVCPVNIAQFVYAWNGSNFTLAGKPVKRRNPECP